MTKDSIIKTLSTTKRNTICSKRDEYKKESIKIFFDTETNGLIRNNGTQIPAIMQIVIFDQTGKCIISLYVIPFDGIIDCTSIHGIDREVLSKNNAMSLINACIYIKNTLYKLYGRRKIVWIAYNTFGFDQTVLEGNFNAVHIKMPSQWYFSDLFPIVKELYPDIKPNHKLATVYSSIVMPSESVMNQLSFHNAETDVLCLYSIYNKIEENNKDDEESKQKIDDLYKKYYRPQLSSNEILQSPVSVLHGYFHKIPFHLSNMNTVNDFYELFKSVNYDIALFEVALREKGIRCNNFVIKCMITNINTIKSFN